MKLRGLHPTLIPYAEWCLDVAAYYGVPVEVTSVYRTWKEQAELRRAYEEGRSAFPANRPGDSAHEYGLAWDSWVPQPYRAWWIEVRRAAGWEVFTSDWIHAQVPRWREIVPRRAG